LSFHRLHTIYKPRTAGTWRYADEDEEVVEISLRTNRIKLWDRIAVGSSTVDLLEFLNEHPHHRQGTSIVATIGGYGGEFQMAGDSVQEVRVRRVCGEWCGHSIMNLPIADPWSLATRS
jgi:hypothetical protein